MPPPPPLDLPFESPLCPASISPRGGAQNWSLSSLSVVSVLKQGRDSTLRRCAVIREGGEKRSHEEGEEGQEFVVVKTLCSSDPSGDDRALREASAHASAFSLAPDAVLPLYAAFRELEEKEGDSSLEREEEEWRRREEKRRRQTTTSITFPPPPPPPPPLHLVLANAAGTARDAAAGSGGFLLEEHASRAVLSALRGCAALHSVGLVHGDVKPENLLILPRIEKEQNQHEEEEEEVEENDSASSSSSPSSSSSRSKQPLLPFSFALSDFGSATPIGGPPPLGTLDFLPPEALQRIISSSAAASASSSSFSSPSPSCSVAGGDSRGNLSPASPAADVWAIGATAVDLLTGSPPFVATPAAAVAAAQQKKTTTTTAATTKAAAAVAAAAALAASKEPLRLPRHLSAQARSFCELCLRKKAEERPSASELCRHEWFVSTLRRR